jgi:pimeloyl-ACP methyl ester carboxylesterase
MTDEIIIPGAGFEEKFAEADGFSIRYMEAGSGPVIVSLHGANGLRLSRTHDMLAESHRVIVVEVPGFGNSQENTRAEDMKDLAVSILAFIEALGLETLNMMGMSFGGKLALTCAILKPEIMESIILIAPAAIRPDRTSENIPTHAQRAAALFAHPERQPSPNKLSAEIIAKQEDLVGRTMGPGRSEAFEAKLAELQVPVLALFGTEDILIPPEIGKYYREILPNCFLMIVYDAAHAIDADRPEAVTELIQDFVVRRGDFIVREVDDTIHP